MKLFFMNKAEFNFWKTRSESGYASDKMKANSISKEGAQKRARDDFKRCFPNGLDSKDCFFYSAKNDTGEVLGYVVLLVRGSDNDRRAFIGDVIIEEQYRGQGYGKQIMELVEREVLNMGLKKIGLHVFGFNNAAIQLYIKMGYVTTDLSMEKDLL